MSTEDELAAVAIAISLMPGLEPESVKWDDGKPEPSTPPMTA